MDYWKGIGVLVDGRQLCIAAVYRDVSRVLCRIVVEPVVKRIAAIVSHAYFVLLAGIEGKGCRR